MADLHAIAIDANGLSHLGKPTGFVGSLVRGWTDRWHRSQTGEIPEMEALADWLPVHLPPEAGHPAIVHGDFKLDNVMLDPHELGRLVAIFDWEMRALGDPLVDLGIFLAYWSQGTRLEPNDALASVTDRLVQSRRGDRLLCREERTRPLVNVVLRGLRTVQGGRGDPQIYFRYRHGQTTDPRFARFDVRVRQLARKGLAATR